MTLQTCSKLSLNKVNMIASYTFFQKTSK
ncbi:hypothetical protein CAEBREN_25566 [Caenorhabditis brenneri]|uniref:Uncharacterized protein n=1 Tax=Caenorhabditis brenneri TaxID=135651 RepID=G0MBB1_CAEBE|nr:hypothetical protein CAEBREN_25566 [Caenorhabditis brenneri]